MDKNQAADLIRQRLREYEAAGSSPLVLLEDRTLTRPFGWVFFYQSRAFVESGNVRDMVAGNTPIIVDRDTGELHLTGTSHPVSHYIREYEHGKRRQQAADRGNCPSCGAPYDNRTEFSLVLTQRAEDGRRVCMAVSTCANCGKSWWRWNDRPNDSLQPLEDRRPPASSG